MHVQGFALVLGRVRGLQWGNPKVLCAGGQKTHWRASVINPAPSLGSVLAVSQKTRLNGFIAASDKRSMRSVAERQRENNYTQEGVGRPDFA